jgi:PPM family protein phosphatase
MLNVTFGQASDPGRLRPKNEDAMGAFVPASRQEARSHGWMFVVADGVGGSDLGEVAAAKTVAVMMEEFAIAPVGTSLTSLLPRLIQYANAAVRDERIYPARRGKQMETTVVSCALRGDQATVSHVGDSRCYLVRDDVAAAVTQDHTLVNEQRKLGLITAEEAVQSEARHILARALGMERFVVADTRTLTLKDNDILVLCSDGVHTSMYDHDIARLTTQKKDVQAIAEELVHYAVEVDGSDNATALVILVHSVEPTAMYRGHPYRLPE